GVGVAAAAPPWTQPRLRRRPAGPAHSRAGAGVGGPVRVGEGGRLGRRRFAPSAGAAAQLTPHSGMLPCFFGGNVSRLFRSARNPRTMWARVFDGRITAST